MADDLLHAHERGAFTKGLSFTDMQTDLLSLIAFPLVFVTFSVLLLKKQEK